jgi:allantoate deiminase
MARLDQLATCTEVAGGITRRFLTPAHRAAVDLVQGWMLQAGLQTTLDGSGTLVGRRPGAEVNAPLLILGSHIDSVRDAGRYDGCLGVVGAIAVAERLRDTALPYALEIRAFGDEEGVRFPVTLTGARATAGTFDAAWLLAADADGVSLGAALQEWGLDSGAIGACQARNAFAYLELHIEQGPVLENAGAALGVVSAINGASRFRVSVRGRAGHAGTVPMGTRQDALVAAAAMILAVRQAALEHQGLVATVGQLSVQPNAVNVIPGACTFSLDLRAPHDKLREAVSIALRASLEDIAVAYGVSVDIVQTHVSGAVACDERLQAVLGIAIEAAGLPVHTLPSGAGHDAMALADLCPVGMLFVRCAGGISHHPDEAVLVEDVEVALNVLTRVLRALNPAEFARTVDFRSSTHG